jgi:hypothetical protein
MIAFDLYWASILTIDYPTTTVKGHDGSQHAKLGNAMDVDPATAHLPTPPLAHARKKASHVRASGSWHASRRRHVRNKTVVIAKLVYHGPRRRTLSISQPSRFCGATCRCLEPMLVTDTGAEPMAT